MRKYWQLWLGILILLPCLLRPLPVAALTAEDVVYQPAEAVSSAIDGGFRDKFVFYGREGIFVPTRLLVESDIKACVDLRQPVCSTSYYSRAEVLKASSLYFAYPILTADDVVNSTLRPAVGNHFMEVVTTWSMTPQGLVLQMEIEKRAEGSTAVERFTRWARFSPSREYAGLRMNFGEQISPNAWMESLTRLRRDSLRGFAGAAIRINNHFFSEKAGRKRIRHGSGFFYRTRNQVMTAWHNLSPNPECQKRLRCELQFMHTDTRGVKRRFQQTVDIIAHSRSADFAIIRLNLPRNIPAQMLPIARDRIGPEVSIIGYPAPGFDLLFSHGYLNSLTAGTERLVASAYVVGGFSGAPVVDLATGQIVGFAKAWQRPKGQDGEGGPVSLNLVKVLEQSFGI